jgi:3-hydroxyacyl-CoA dehydrogenase
MNHPLLQEHVAVIGAAGKMGAGISLLLVQERLRAEAEAFGVIKPRHTVITLVDASRDGLLQLKLYLRDQLLRYAEKNIVPLRRYFANNQELVSNREIVDHFIEQGLEIIQITDSLTGLQDVTLCFEAIDENVDSKTALFKAIDAIAKKPPLYFTNTSAIPISVLEGAAGLAGRIIGFHFYNPPPVQTLLELVSLQEASGKLCTLAVDIAKTLGKTVVPANDKAGFIGNGYLLREVISSCHAVKGLLSKHPLPTAVGMVEQVSGEFLLRPMGIFQLVEYVGFDLVLKIGAIMNRYLPAPLYDEELVSFLKQCRPYFGEKNVAKELIGPLPPGHLSWKALAKDRDKESKIKSYMQQLHMETTCGAQLAMTLLKGTRDSARTLVQEGVAASARDVDVVLKEGFYHLYGADVYGII